MENNEPLSGEFSLAKDSSQTSVSPQAVSESPKTKKANTTPPSPTSLSKTRNPVHFYTAFCERPDGVTFDAQEEDEEILLLIRQHFVTNLPWIFGALLLIIIPLFIIPFISQLLPIIQLEPITQVFFVLFYYLVVFGFILLNFSLWYFHVALVTNKRIIDVDLYGILVREVAETKLDLVEDVSYTQIGFIQSFFNFGDVDVQTAGPTSNVEFEKAPKPVLITRILGDLIG